MLAGVDAGASPFRPLYRLVSFWLPLPAVRSAYRLFSRRLKPVRLPVPPEVPPQPQAELGDEELGPAGRHSVAHRRPIRIADQRAECGLPRLEVGAQAAHPRVVDPSVESAQTPRATPAAGSANGSPRTRPATTPMTPPPTAPSPGESSRRWVELDSTWLRLNDDGGVDELEDSFTGEPSPPPGEVSASWRFECPADEASRAFTGLRPWI